MLDKMPIKQKSQKEQKQQNLKGSDSGSKSIQDYSFNYSDILGKGNFSTVYKATHQENKNTFAIKVVQLASLKSEKLAELLNSQIKIIKKLNHKNVVRCFQVLTSLNNCYIITELCEEGDLQSKLKKKGTAFQQKEIYSIVKDIYQGLSYLSQENIVHRDLKMSNIFLKAGTAKIADFGFAKITKESFTDMSIGSPLYMSPEGFLKNVYGRKTDVWAFGILLYELVHGNTPFSMCKNQKELGQKITKQLKMQDLNPQLSQSLKSLILRCLDCNQNTRIEIEDIKDTPFMKKTYYLSQSLKKYNDLVLGARNPTINLYGDNNAKSQRSTSLFTPKDNKLLNKLHNIYSPSHIHSKQIARQSTQPIKESEENKKIYNFVTSKNQNGQKNQLKSVINHQNNSKSPFHYKPTVSAKIPYKNLQNKQKHQTKKMSESYRQQNKLFNHFEVTQYNGNTQSTLNSKIKDSQNLLGHSQTLQNFANHYKNWLKSPLSKRSSQITDKYFQKPVSSKNINLSKNLQFSQALGLLHYCRLCFKYINAIVSYDIQSNPQYAVWIINILEELLNKIETKNIIFDASKSNKQLKFKEVLKEYISKYSEQFKKKTNFQSSNSLTITSFEILQLFKQDFNKIDNDLPNKLSQKYLTCAYYSLILCQQTNQIKKSEEIGNFSYFSTGLVEEMLSEKTTPITMQLYLSTRRERTF